jgi:hypothetical protein
MANQSRTPGCKWKRRRRSHKNDLAAQSTPAAARPKGVDRDALLRVVFPTGLPADDQIIRAANEWLARAEQILEL